MKRWTKPTMYVGVGLTAGLLIGVGIAIGVVSTSDRDQSSQISEFPFTALHASATHAGDTFAIATGEIESDVEGLFTLDSITGDLQCVVLNPRNGTPFAVYKYNVLGDLGVIKGKAIQLLMVTGKIQPRAFSGNTRPANTVVYVADAKSGAVAGYAVPWNRTAARSNQGQANSMMKLFVAKARNLAIRGK